MRQLPINNLKTTTFHSRVSKNRMVSKPQTSLIEEQLVCKYANILVTHY